MSSSRQKNLASRSDLAVTLKIGGAALRMEIPPNLRIIGNLLGARRFRTLNIQRSSVLSTANLP